MTRCGCVIAIVACVGITLAASSAVSQTNTVEVTGVVRDATGGVLPGALVVATQPSTGTSIQRVTDAEGRFFLHALQIGAWDITVTMQEIRPADQARPGLGAGANRVTRHHTGGRRPRRADRRGVGRTAPAEHHRGNQRRHRQQKSMYPAEFGGKASALINVATKAGTTLRGTGFEFFRDEAVDSRNYFQPASEPLPGLRQNQFGGTLGGPVVRDRTFVFGSYEGLRLRRSLTRPFSVPSSAVRAGDFSGLDTICDPLTIAGSGACAPFPANRIPAERIDPIASAFLRHVPVATAAGNVQNLFASEQQQREIDQVTIRFDHRFDSGDQLFARVSTFDADETQPFGTSVLQETLVPGFGRSLRTTTRSAAVSHTRLFG